MPNANRVPPYMANFLYEVGRYHKGQIIDGVPPATTLVPR